MINRLSLKNILPWGDLFLQEGVAPCFIARRALGCNKLRAFVCSYVIAHPACVSVPFPIKHYDAGYVNTLALMSQRHQTQTFAMRYLILPLFLLIILSVTQAQAPSDALRFTQLIPGGSARMIASGGAFTALGGDFGVISLNPAGLADYRANEFVLSPSLRFSRSNSRLVGAGNNAFEEDKTGFGFDNLGIVFHNQPSGKWVTSNFAIGFNRLANYGQSYYYEGRAPGSIMTPFYEEARQVFETGGDERNLYPFTSGLAWDANGLYRQDGVLSYDFLGFEDASVARSHTLSTSGGYNELSFAFAGNYNEKFLVGMNVGVPIVRYRIEGEYREENIDGEVPFFDRLSYTEYLQTSGVGFNMKLGMVYRVTPNFRMGAAFHTPTFLGLTDRYNNSMRYAYTDGNGPNAGIEQFSPEGVTDYRYVRRGGPLLAAQYLPAA